MTCPIDHAQLVRYWCAELDDVEAEAVEGHLFECDRCFAATSDVAAMAAALRAAIPPFLRYEDVASARARGLRILENPMQPGEVRDAFFAADVDLLVHLFHADLGDVARVSVAIESMAGEPVMAFPDVPFAASDGAIVVACQRHFASLASPAARFRVSLHDASGGERQHHYDVNHLFP